MRIVENVTYQLRGADGKLKALFSVNKFGQKLLKLARKNYNAYNESGQRKTGLRAKLALEGLRIPFLTGNWVNSMLVSNVVTTTGKAAVASRINGADSEPAFAWIGIGIGTTGAVVGNTALETERDEDGATNTTHKAAAVSRTTTDTTDDTATHITTFNFTATLAVTESGVFNASPTGVILCRQTFSAINVVNGDSLQVTWDIDVD